MFENKAPVIDFIKHDIWQIPEHDTRKFKVFLLKTIRIFLLSCQGFVQDLCMLRSSALTMYTLLSIVPVIAMLFGVAKGFGVEQMLRERLLEQIPQQETMVLQLLTFSENLLATAKGGVVAGIGIVVLFWTVIKVIGNIEESFNAIWKIKQSRELSRKLSDYLSLMLLAPIMLILSSSITVFLNTQLTWLMTSIRLPDFGVWLLLKVLGLSPTLIMSVLFTFLFIFLPNSKVNLKAGIISGIITGVVYQTLQWLYLTLQIGVSSYNAIYGSFAALPLFLISLQIGWMIVLFGCEICFFIQNYQIFKNNKKYVAINFYIQKATALQIMHLLAVRFKAQKSALNSHEISVDLKLPINVVEMVISKLKQSNLVVEFRIDDTEKSYYQPAVDTSQLSVYMVLNSLERSGFLTLPDSRGIEEGLAALDDIDHLLEAKFGNRLLHEL